MELELELELEVEVEVEVEVELELALALALAPELELEPELELDLELELELELVILLLSTLRAHASLSTLLQFTEEGVLCTSIFLTSFRRTNIMSIVISLLKTNVCQQGHFIHSHESHTSLSLQTLSPVSTLDLPNLPHPSFFFARNSIFQPKLFLPKTE